MSVFQTPIWLEVLDATEATAALKASLRDERRATAALRIKMDAPGFIAGLLQEISITVECLKERGRTSSVTVSGNPNQPHSAYITVGSGDIRPKLTWTNLVFANGTIQCVTPENCPLQLRFCVGDDDEVGMMSSDSAELMDAKTVTRIVMERMVRLVRS